MMKKKLNKTDDIANNQQEKYLHKRYCALITCNTLIPRKKFPINILLIRREKIPNFHWHSKDEKSNQISGEHSQHACRQWHENKCN